MKNSLTLPLLILFIICGRHADAQHWNVVGAPAFSAGGIEWTTTVIDRNGWPYVAYSDVTDTYRASVMRYNGISWEYVGLPDFTPSEASNLEMAIDSAGNLYLLFQDADHDGHASVMKYDGTSWNYVGAPGFSPYSEGNDAIALDKLGNIYVAIGSAPGTEPGWVMEYDGTGWAAVGGGAISPGMSSWVSVAVDSNNVPYVAYSDLTNHYKATVKKFDGTSWTTVGSPAFTDSAIFINLAFDYRGNLYIAYQDIELALRASVMKYAGGTWAPLGGLGFTPTGAYYVTLAIDTANNIYVGYENCGVLPAFDYNEADCMRYTHGAWYTVGNADFSPVYAWFTTIALSPWGRPYMAMQDGLVEGPAIAYRLDIPAVTGPNTVCAGSAIALHDTAIFGRWVSANTSIATVNDTSGIVTGVSAGMDAIFYIDYGDTVSAIITVTPLPDTGAVTGPSVVCLGDTIILADTAAGGAWSSANTSASVTDSMVIGMAAGADTIFYSVTNGCGTRAAIKIVDVSKYAGVITGRDTVCIGDTIALGDAVTGGTWTISGAAVASVSAAGVVLGLASGIDTISYAVSNACGDTFARYRIIVPNHCNEGVPEQAMTAGIQVYPIPNAGVFSVQVVAAGDGPVILILATITGQQAGKYETRTNTPIHIRANLPPGIYLLSAVTDEAKYVVRVVVE